jgi:hypothetical protein
VAQSGGYVRLIVEREGALGAFASVPERDIRGTIDLRRGGWGRRGDPSSGALVGHCHDRSRSFDLSPCFAALVWT